MLVFFWFFFYPGVGRFICELFRDFERSADCGFRITSHVGKQLVRTTLLQFLKEKEKVGGSKQGCASYVYKLIMFEYAIN